MQCSNCGALNNEGVTSCWSCGASLAPGVGQEYGQPQHVQCSNCGALNNQGVTACWSCGASIAPDVGQEYAQPEHVQCSNCGALNNQSVTACWSCGAGIAPSVGQSPPVQNYLVWTIIVTVVTSILAFPLGLIGIASIVFASQVNGKLSMGDVEGALDASKKAKMWMFITLGVSVGAFVLIFLLAFGLAMLAVVVSEQAGPVY